MGKQVTRQDAIKEQINTEYHKTTLWALTFTKKLVIIIMIFFIIQTIYTDICIIQFGVYDVMSLVFENACRFVEVIAFGYLVKAGFENVPRIILGMKKTQDPDPMYTNANEYYGNHSAYHQATSQFEHSEDETVIDDEEGAVG